MTTRKMRILGIDPGTGICGFGVIEVERAGVAEERIATHELGINSATGAREGDVKNTRKTSELESTKNLQKNTKTSAQPTPKPTKSLYGAAHGKVVNSMALGGRAKMVDSGVIATPPHTPLMERLLDIYDSLGEIIELNQPEVVAIEKLFFSQNITTGISVAEARGVVLLVCGQHRLPVYEYSPNEIKKAMTGYGFADKKQMQEMVRLHLGLATAPKPDDAADALAAAITHSLVFRG